MKKAIVFMAIMLTLIILSTGTVFAASNGVEAKANDRNPAFEVRGMGEMEGMMVVNVNNEDLHFSRVNGHIMIPGNGGEKAQAPVFKITEMDNMTMTHLEPSGRVEQFDHGMD